MKQYFLNNHSGLTCLLLVASTSLFGQDLNDKTQWETSIGIERLSFYANDEAKGISKSPLNRERSSFGAGAAVGKWLTPTIGIRTKGGAYWGKRISSEQAGRIHFYYMEGQMMTDLSELCSPGRRGKMKIVGFAGAGLSRDCSHDDNSIAATAGISFRYSLSRQLGIYTDFSFSSGGSSKSFAAERFGKYKWIGVETGLVFSMGNKRKKTTKPIYFSPVLETEDVYGTQKRQEEIPRGMALIRRGHLRMGDATSDSLLHRPVGEKDVNVEDFWMDRTEITNGQWREFVNAVRDSIIRERTEQPLYLDDEEGAWESLMHINNITGRKETDIKLLNYKYEVFNEVKAVINWGKLTVKDTAYTDEWGNIYTGRILRKGNLREDFVNTFIVNVYPDTTCWVTDFQNADNGRYMKYYWADPAYENYPVVGISWKQARAYCHWRTAKDRTLGILTDDECYRLPTEAEWEYAARGYSQDFLPWNNKNNLPSSTFANFQTSKGNLAADGNIITATVGSYPPNEFGLYDMAGNVAEWTEDAFDFSHRGSMSFINPEGQKEEETRKTVKGGSWKDPLMLVKATWSSGESLSAQHSYIGFRCVKTVIKPVTRKPIL